MADPENRTLVQAGVRSYSARQIALFARPFGAGFVIVGLSTSVGSRVLAAVLGVPRVRILLIGLAAIIVLIVVLVLYYRRLPPLSLDLSSMELVDGSRRYRADEVVAARENIRASRILALTVGPRVVILRLETPKQRMTAAQRDALVAFLEASAIQAPQADVAIDRQYDPKGRFANVTGNGDLDRDGTIAYVRRTRVQRDDADPVAP